MELACSRLALPAEMRRQCTNLLRSSTLPRGIVNIGNTCFLNSVLQALASIKSIHTYLSELTKRKPTPPFSLALRTMLNRLSSRDTQDPLRPDDFLAKAPQLRRRFFADGRQQDAQELLHHIVNLLEEEARQPAVLPFLSTSQRTVPGLVSCFDLQASGIATSASTSTTTTTTTTTSTSATSVISTKPTLETAQSLPSLLPPVASTPTQPLPHPLASDLTTQAFALAAATSGEKQQRDMLFAARPPSPGSPPPASSSSDSGIGMLSFGTKASLTTGAPSSFASFAPPASSIAPSSVITIPKALSEPVIRASTSQSQAAPIVSPFSGMLANELYCGSTKVAHVQFESFLDISLTIPRKQHVSLADCLDEYIRPEQVSDYHCSHCNTNHSVRKRLRIGRPPKALLFHFSRQFYTGYGEAKLRSFVEFPLVLDLFHYRYDEPEEQTFDTKALGRANWRYNLQAVVVHLGDSGAGHFVTYRRYYDMSELMPTDYRWIKNDDSSTTTIEEREVLAAQAYILLYEKDVFAL